MIWLPVFALIIVLLVILNSWFVVQHRLARSRCPCVGQIVPVGGLGLHCVIRGVGRPVVCLHGNDGSFLDFSTTILELIAKNYQGIVFDRPGHGYSGRPASDGGSPVTQARLIHHALTQLRVEKPLLVAHSWSGFLALAYALEHPTGVSGVVLLGAAVYARRHRLPTDKRIALIPIAGSLIYCTTAPLIGGILLRRALQRAFAPHPVPAGWLERCAPFQIWSLSQVRAVAEDFRGPWGIMPSLEERYREIRVPVIVVTGDCDRSVPPEQQSYRLHRQIAGSSLVVVPGGGHMLQFTHPTVVADAIEAVWRRADATIATI